ncbi:hypothetical protein P167DRAFT_523456 [Morchella conica CCBAS932]|uniref:Glycosylphosphatidylinositol anchor biosynthesis protein 11 n=1 Tax=Morchella conica CCBAS932 TaxID=1392247 RepID=A0A3N4KNP4_9PEZI|nr:hypothetical protein P167DRAFT_523456 [Morchella conica CCBAS932]
MPSQNSKSQRGGAPAAVSFFATHLHSAVIAGVSYASFGNLVLNPTSTLLSTLPLLTVAQAVYVVLCLDGNGATKEKRPRVGKKGEQLAAATGISNKLLTAFLSLLLASTVGTVILGLCMVLFGAPVTSHLSHTTLCAAHMALLVAFPLIYTNGVDGQKWRDIVSVTLPIDEAFGGALGALVGGWLGAVPIPLDWDREWQKWPVTIVTGVYIGHLVGKSLGSVFQGKKLPF